MARPFKSNRSDTCRRFRYRGLYAGRFFGKTTLHETATNPDRSNGVQLMADLIRLRKNRSPQRGLFFTKKELGQLLALYSSRVISGEWRDYSIDQSDDGAAFSIFRHSQELPLFSVSKKQRKGQRQPTFELVSGYKKIASSPSLVDVISRFEKLPRLVTG